MNQQEEQRKEESSGCFVIIRFRSDTEDHDYKANHVYFDYIRPFIENQLNNIECIRGDLNQDGRKKPIDIIHRDIEQSVFVIADITVYRHNVFYEIGYAIAKGIPVLLIKDISNRRIGEIPFDIRHLSVVGYQNGVGSQAFSQILTLWMQTHGLNNLLKPQGKKNSEIYIGEYYVRSYRHRVLMELISKHEIMCTIDLEWGNRNDRKCQTIKEILVYTRQLEATQDSHLGKLFTDGVWKLFEGKAYYNAKETDRKDYYLDGYGIQIHKDFINAFVWDSVNSKQSFVLDRIHYKAFKVNNVEFKMIYVKGGEFTMGKSVVKEKEAYDDESPTHIVSLNDFWVGETPVTQELWEVVMGNNPSYFKGPQRPVECVSWDDVKLFMVKIQELTDTKFRLLTEAEWEYAANGGRKTHYYKYSGSEDAELVGWIYNNSDSQTHNVKQKMCNEIGLYDMTGNVFEWCYDYKGRYGNNFQFNPQGPNWGEEKECRGGSWKNHDYHCRNTFRNGNKPIEKANYLGFRLALSIEEV